MASDIWRQIYGKISLKSERGNPLPPIFRVLYTTDKLYLMLLSYYIFYELVILLRIIELNIFIFFFSTPVGPPPPPGMFLLIF